MHMPWALKVDRGWASAGQQGAMSRGVGRSVMLHSVGTLPTQLWARTAGDCRLLCQTTTFFLSPDFR